MKRIAKAATFGLGFWVAIAMTSCGKPKQNLVAKNDGRKIIKQAIDPSGKWNTILDEVEYANGLLTSMADRVSLVGPKSKDVDGVLIFSEDAMPDGEKPTVSWESNNLVITISPNANVLFQEKQMGEVRIEVRRR